MANETSKAPKERINIGFTSPIGNAKEEIKIPHLFVLAGDWNGRGVKDQGEKDATDFQKGNGKLKDRTLIPITKISDLKDAFNKQELRLNFIVDNKLSGDQQKEKELKVNLEIKVDENEPNCLMGFRPEKIAAQVPEIQKKLAIRRAVMEFRNRLNKPDFAREISKILQNEEETKQLLDELFARNSNQ